VTRFRYLSFLTDYGLEDGFVAACHGVAARIAPHASVIDVTHLVPPGDVRRGAAVLAQTVPYLPPAVAGQCHRDLSRPRYIHAGRRASGG